MSAPRPAWRLAYDAVESLVTPRIQALTRTEQFAVTIGAALRARHAVLRRTERATRRALHAVNLPAATDTTRILTELGRLQREMTRLSRQLDVGGGAT
jgi:hypothetical protein